MNTGETSRLCDWQNHEMHTISNANLKTATIHAYELNELRDEWVKRFVGV